MEYQFYNRYHSVNNTINTLVLEGLVEGGYYRDCLVLFSSLLLDIRFKFSSSCFIHNQIDWLKVLTTAHVGMKETDEPATNFSLETKRKLFFLSNEKKDDVGEHRGNDDDLIRLHFSKDDMIGKYIIMNKRAYHQAIASSCALRHYDFANMLYEVLVLNRIKPRKNTYYSLIRVGLSFVIFQYNGILLYSIK